MMKLRTQLLCAIATMGVAATHANAQQDFYSRDKYEAVKDRNQPDFDPEAVRLGTFLVNAGLTAGVTATDNVFAASGNTAAEPEESDTIVNLSADVDARTDWTNHQIGLRGRLGRSEYSDISDESFTDVNVGGFGRLDVSRSFALTADVNFTDTVQPRSAYGNGAQLDGPVEFSRSRLLLSANYQNDRIQWLNNVVFQQSDFEDGFFRNTNTVFDQDFRDNDTLSATSRVSYAISPNVAVFGQGQVQQRDYDITTTVTDPVTLLPTTRTRDSDGYTLATGVNFETTNLLRGDIAVGFFSEDKKDEAFEDVDGLSVDGNLEWFPSRLTTVGVNAGRRVVDVGIIESPTSVQTTLGATVDHEFSRQIVGSVFASILEDDYQEINRTDDYQSFGAGLTYKLNKRMHLTGTIENLSRDSNAATAAFDPSFTTNRFGVALTIYP